MKGYGLVLHFHSGRLHSLIHKARGPFPGTTKRFNQPLPDRISASPRLVRHRLLKLRKVWVAVQKSCGVSFPTDVQPPVANISTPIVATTSGTNECLSGNMYTIQSDDNCQTIAASKNVATGTLSL
jgi:hypothetical protein